MRKAIRSLLVKGSIMVMVGVMGSFPVWAQEGPKKIHNLKVEGNQRVEAETIRSLLVTDSGGGFSSGSLNASLKSLFDSGYFADVKLRLQGNTLIVTVQENPIVNQISIEGNSEIKDDLLKPELKLRPREVFTQGRLKADVEKMQTLYRLKGYFATIITPKLIRREQNRVDVVFEVEEGKATKVSRVFFVGNKHFSESKLQEAIQTKESRWYRFFSSDDNYDPDRMNYDKELLRLFYLQRGYADFRVKSAVAELTPDRKEFFITFTIEEGQRYTVDKVDVKSQVPKVDPQTLKSVLTVNSGDWYNNKEVEKSIDMLTSQLGRLGYAFVDINPDLEKNTEKHTLNLTFEIQEGPRVYIDKIRIVGNTRTDEDVIRRELLFYEGDAFNSDKVKKSERRLRNLGFFKNVKIDREASEFPDKLNITIDVEEDRTGELSIGGGFSTTDGPLADLRFAEHNFRGRGQDLGAGVTWAKRRQEFDLSFTEPYFMDKDLQAGFDLFSISQNQYFNHTFDQKMVGGTLRLGYTLAEDLYQQLSYTLRHERISGISNNVSRFIREQKRKDTVSEVGQMLTYDKRDNRQSPTEGYVMGIGNNMAGVGGSVKYLKNMAFAGYYYSLIEDVILEVAGRGSVMSGLGKAPRVVDRYTLGGETLRGFEVSGVSPRDRITNDPLGGQVSYIGTVEVTFPLGFPKEFGVRGAVFADAGNVVKCGSPKNAIIESSKIRSAIGGGLLWRSPMGPIKIYFAKAMTYEKFDKKQVMTFGMQTRF